MISYRQLTPTDFEQFWALDSYAFARQYHRGRYTPDVIAQLRGLFVNGEHVAQLQIMPFQMQAGNGELPVGAIGSVATWPQHRRRGYAEQLLRHACNELREQGAVLALLHPFRHDFYHRLGWALAGERRLVQPAPFHLRAFQPAPGAYIPAGLTHIAELDAIYRGALRGRYGPLVRPPEWWQVDVLQTWGGEPYHAFIWRDEQGKGRSYLIYRLERSDNGDRLVCRDIVALDPLARAQLFVFIARHADQIIAAEIPTPIDAPLNALLPAPAPTTVVPLFMQRVLDVKHLLSLYPFAPATGQLTIQIADDWMPDNAGRYQLAWHDGRTTVTRLGPGEADLASTSATLSQLLSRYLRPRTAAAFGVLSVSDRRALALLEQALAGLPPFCGDYW
ncbi:GCN5 family acetyltransferase [Chloroflexus islandicus]|uniref:GCN5 family acetyltransferase n=1 Tax=Chloroflexus islandicus TaxID=1707952 RepID=A0A178MLX4_9CHLR|nr:GNAT family N-acetyltransferase [Chloroflexus islandicus]OAN49078.1 GCN5 family acetyltransferase [Chloroflexus islandicus]